MKPRYPNKCEICKKFTPTVFDGRIRRSRFGAKGHWMFLCPICHYIWGLGYGHNDLIIYESIAGNYYEVKKGIIEMDQKKLKDSISEIISKESGEDAWKILLLGEISLQLAGINEKLEALVGYMASVEAHLQFQVPKPLIVEGTDPYAMEAEDVDKDNN